MKLDFTPVDIAVEKVIAKHEYLFKLEMLMREPIVYFPQTMTKFVRAFQLGIQFKRKIIALEQKQNTEPAAHSSAAAHSSGETERIAIPLDELQRIMNTERQIRINGLVR